MRMIALLIAAYFVVVGVLAGLVAWLVHDIAPLDFEEGDE